MTAVQDLPTPALVVDTGAFEHNGERVFWKIDCYDRAMEFGSEDPADPQKTTRVLTIMLAGEC